MNTQDTKNLIKQILQKYNQTKDDDMLLYEHLVNLFGFSVTLPIVQIHILVREGRLPHFRTVHRVRQKLQEEESSLRGKLWDKRHKIADEMRVSEKKIDFTDAHTLFSKLIQLGAKRCSLATVISMPIAVRAIIGEWIKRVPEHGILSPPYVISFMFEEESYLFQDGVTDSDSKNHIECPKDDPSGAERSQV